METWKVMEDADAYEVSDQGRIRRISTGRIMKQAVTSWGYCRASLHQNGRSLQMLVHRAVAKAFVNNPDPDNKIQVNHIDCDKTNNRAENLEWTTPVENMAHAYAHDLVPSARKKAVDMVEKDFTYVETFSSATEASIELIGNKSGQGNITRSAQSSGKSTALGYRWFYRDDPFPEQKPVKKKVKPND